MTRPPKALFLDVDGPMVPARAFALPGNNFAKYGWIFDPAAVAMLNFIHWSDPSVKIVISSHRLFDRTVPSPYPELFKTTDSAEFWEHHFDAQGIKMELHKHWHTPRLRFKNEWLPRPKHIEVHSWLHMHPEVKRFVVLEDDLNGGDYVSPKMRKDFHLVAESYDNGVTWEDFKKMCQYLGLTLSQDKYVEYTASI